MVSNREAFQQFLTDADIPTAIHYPIPLNEQPAYQHLCCPDCTPIAKALAKRVMSLPMSPELSNDDQLKIISTVKEAINKLGL
jgi:UDP-2-acetamido-2-deoxy-ribo-hexuluronate aminotransferase